MRGQLSFEQIDTYVRQRVADRKKGLAPKRFAAFVSSQSAWAKVRPASFDEDHEPPGGHLFDDDDDHAPAKPKRGPFREPKRPWTGSENPEDSPEDKARAAEFEQRAEEEAADDIVVSPDVRVEDAPPTAPNADADRADPDETTAAPDVEQPTDGSRADDRDDGEANHDDDDDDDVTPVGFGRD